jgi:hypothetical protein
MVLFIGFIRDRELIKHGAQGGGGWWWRAVTTAVGVCMGKKRVGFLFGKTRGTSSIIDGKTANQQYDGSKSTISPFLERKDPYLGYNGQ